MPNPLAHADLIPADPRAPFANPTEEPDFSPDYRSIAPELELPQSRLPLLPSPQEKSRIRRYFELTFLAVIFAFLVALTVKTALELLISILIRQIDLRAIAELPENYESILSLYYQDSALAYAVTLIAFLVGNLSAFFLGAKLTHLRIGDCFRTRDLRFHTLLSYILLALWIQLTTGHLASLTEHITQQLGLHSAPSDVTFGGSMHRTAVFALYCCVVAPVTEELLMRGLVLKNLCRVSQRLGIMCSALIFAVIHENLPQMLFAFPLGILLAYITIRHNSLTPAIAVHVSVNTVQLGIRLAAEYLPAATYSQIMMFYSLGLLLIGAVILALMLLTELLPVPTPHQSMRGWRLVLSTPLFWLLISMHICFGLYQAGLLMLPFKP